MTDFKIPKFGGVLVFKSGYCPVGRALAFGACSS